jgi:hypothetical protein
MEFVAWLQELPLSEWVQTSDYGFPLLLAAHSIGLAGVVGILIVLDLRVLGLAEGIPIAALSRLMPVAWCGFVINALSGILLFMANATRLVTNWAFILKMSAVVLGGIVSWMLWRSLAGGASATPLTTTPFATTPFAAAATAAAAKPAATFIVTRNARIIAVLSLVVWFGAILFGRVIAYVMDHAILHGGG